MDLSVVNRGKPLAFLAQIQLYTKLQIKPLANFNIHFHFQQRKRYAFLKQSQLDPDDKDMDDAIMQGEVAKMVYRQAIEQMPGM